MTTYNSYEEAKIANPESVIVQNQGNFDAVENVASSQMYRWGECNPADHCMTYNQCDEFSAGMIVLEMGIVGELSVVSAAILNTAKADPIQRESWDGYYILCAAALEKPKRVKVEYVKVELTSDYEHLKLMIDGEKFYTWDGGCEYSFNGARFIGEEKPNQIRNAEWSNPRPSELCRRIGIPIEWWEDASELINQTDCDNCSSIMNGRLHVNATLTKEQWCDFARILLEQEKN